MYFYYENKQFKFHTLCGDTKVEDALCLSLLKYSRFLEILGIAFISILCVSSLALMIFLGLEVNIVWMYIVFVSVLLFSGILVMLLYSVIDNLDIFTQNYYIQSDEFKQIKLKEEQEAKEKRLQEEALAELTRKAKAKALLRISENLDNDLTEEEKIERITQELAIFEVQENLQNKEK